MRNSWQRFADPLRIRPMFVPQVSRDICNFCIVSAEIHATFEQIAAQIRWQQLSTLRIPISFAPTTR